MIYPEFSADELISAMNYIREWHEPRTKHMFIPSGQLLRAVEVLDSETYHDMLDQLVWKDRLDGMFRRFSY